MVLKSPIAGAARGRGVPGALPGALPHTRPGPRPRPRGTTSRAWLTSARRDRACTLYTEGADADTIVEAAAAVAAASADEKASAFYC